MDNEEFGTTGSVLVRTEGMYLAVFDRSSAANTPGLFARLLEEARRLAGGEAASAIPHLNALLGDLARSGALLSWPLVFEGVFRVRVALVEGHDTGHAAPDEPTAFVAGIGPEATLSCPTGEIVVGSLHMLGDGALTAALSAVPGTYLASLSGDTAEQVEHQFLDEIADYPSDGGPDWTLRLRRL